MCRNGNAHQNDASHELLGKTLNKRMSLYPVDLEGIQIIDPFWVFLKIIGKPTANQVVKNLLAHMIRSKREQGEEYAATICR